MAVLPMKKVLIVGLRKNRKQMLELLQRQGVMQIEIRKKAEDEQDPVFEQIDTTGLSNHLLVVLAFSYEVRGITIEDVDVLLRTVDMVEEVTGHESMVALGMGLGQTNILIHVEGDDILERYLTGTIGLNEGIVHANG